MCEIYVFSCLSVLFISAVYLPEPVLASGDKATTANAQPAAANLVPEPVITDDVADSCSIICTGTGASDQSFLKYKEKEPYRYKVEGSNFIFMPSSVKGEATQLSYVAAVDLVAESKCSFALRISNIEITGPGGSKKTSPTLTKYSVRFSWNGGKLGKLCVDKREAENDANFKRSLISNFQIPSLNDAVSGGSTYETDVYGYCPVTVEVSQELDGSRIFKKTKNLNQCSHRQGFDFAIKTGSLNSNRPSVNPFIDSTSNSVIRVEKDVIKSIQVNEEYNYQPLSNYVDSKTRVTVTTKITLMARGKNRPTFETTNLETRSLFYEPVKSYDGKSSTIPSIVRAIQEASKEVDGVLPETAASDFNKLIQTLRQSKKKDILTAWMQVKSGAGVENAERALIVFWDGLLSCATPAAVEASALFLENKEMPADKIWEFLASLSFVKHPTDETLASVSSLLDGPTVDTDRYLAVGSLIYKYILDNPNKTSPNLTALLEKLSRPLFANKAKTVEEQDAVISSLKGIRNAHYMTPEVRNTIIKYSQDTQTPARLRVVAIQALTAISSQPEVVKVAEQLLQNQEEDSEIRIHSFLLLVDSPSAQVAQIVKNVIDSEKSDQVGSYIASYIRNLRDTESPKKQAQKQYLGNIRSKTRFPFDIRQYSRNYEFSHSCPRANLAISGEGDVIFSRQSYIPRSTSLNLDVSLFGNTLNLFELGTRFENIEHLLNNVLGPRSYLRTTKAEQIADDLSSSTRSFISQMTEKASTLNRSKRSVAEEVQEKVETAPKKAKRSSKQKDAKQNASVKDSVNLDIDLSLKMFESEVLWSAYHLNDGNMATSQYMDSLFAKIYEAIQNAKNLNINFKKYHRCPLVSNNVIYYPTSSGLPIKLSTNAVGIVSFKMTSNNLNSEDVSQRDENSGINFSILPSAMLQVDGNLEVDASIVSVGLKASSSVHTATGMSVDLTMLNGQGFDLKFGLPVREQDLYTVETRAYSTAQEQGHPVLETPLKPGGRRYNSNRKYDQLATLTGLSLITEVSTPDYMHSPFLGPSKFSIRLKKEDEGLQFYQARLFYNNKDQDIRTFEFLLDTPGSKINRQMAINVEANKPKKKYLVRYIGWGKQLAAEATDITRKNEVGFDVKVTNDNSVYNLKIGANVAKDKEKTVYKPFIEVKTPLDVRDVSMDEVRVTPKTTNQQQQQQFLNVEGTITLRKLEDRPNYRNYEFQQLSLTSPLGKHMVEGSVIYDNERPEYNVDLKATYGKSKYVVVQGGYENGIGKETETKAHVGLLSSQYPLYGFKIMHYMKETDKMRQRDTTFAHGPDINSDIMKLSINEKYAWITKPKSQKVESGRATVTVKYPLCKLDGALDLQQKNNNFYKAQARLNVDKSTDLRFNGSVGIGNVTPGNINAQFESQFNEKRLTVNATRELKKDDQSLITVDATATPGKQLVAEIDVTHRISPQVVVIKITPKITILPSKSFYKYNLAYVNTPDEKSMNVAAYPLNERSLEVGAGYTLTPPGLKASAVLFIVNNIDATLNLDKTLEKLTSDLKVDLKKMNRLVTGSLDLNVKNAPKLQNYKGVMELKWDKDPKKRLRIETNTSVATESTNIKTKNALQLEDIKFDINANLQMSNIDTNEEKLKADFTFNRENGCSFGGQIERNLSFLTSGLNYDLDLATFYASSVNAPQTSAKYSLRSKNVNTITTTYDITSNLSVTASNNKNGSLDIRSTRSLDGKSKYWTTNTDVSVTGALVSDKKIGFTVDIGYPEVLDDATKVDSPWGTIRMASNYGDDYVVNTTGKITNSVFEAEIQGKTLVDKAPFPFQWKTETKYDFKPSELLFVRTVHSGSWGANKYAKAAGELNVQPENGKLRLGLESTDLSKRSLDVAYAHGKEKKDGQDGFQGPFADAKFNLRIGKDVTSIDMKTEFSKDLSARSLTINGNTLSSGEFNVRAISKNENGYRDWFNEIALMARKKEWKFSNRVKALASQPALDLLYSSPEGESKFSIQFEERTSNYWTGETNLQWQHGGQGYVRAKTELKLDSADDIMMKIQFDSPVMGQKNVVVNASSKSGDNGSRKLSFGMRSDDGPRYSGILPYIYKNENGKLSVEGSGMIKVNDTNIPVTFKFNRQLLTEKQNSETGNINTFYLNIDKKKYVLDMKGKFTDKTLLLKRDLWYGEKVYKMDLLYQSKMTDPMGYEKTFLAHVDLKPHVPDGETFVFDGKSTRSLSNYDSQASFSWSPEKKIMYNLNRVPGKTSFTLTLPQRQIGAEAVYDYKLDTANGLAKLTGTLWFDKIRNENDKAMFNLGTEFKLPETETGIAARSSVGIRLPTLPKDLGISTALLLSPMSEKVMDFVCKLDLFKRKEDTVNVTYQIYRERSDDGVGFTEKLKITSQGQNLKAELIRQTMIHYSHLEYHYSLTFLDYQNKSRSASADFEIRLNSLAAKIQLLEHITLNGSTEIAFTKDYLQITNNLNILGHEYRQLNRFTTDPKIMFLLEWRGKEVRQAAQAIITMELEKFVKVDAQLAGRGTIATFILFLDDEKFMKSKTELFIDNADILLDNGVRDINSLIEESKTAVKSLMDDLNAQLIFRRKKFDAAYLDMKPVMSTASEYMASLRAEIKQDLADAPFLQRTVNGVVDFALAIVEQMTKFFAEWVDDCKQIIKKFGEYYDHLLQQTKSAMESSVGDASKQARDIMNNVQKYGKQVLAFVKEHKAKWSEAVTSISGLVKDMYVALIEAYEQLNVQAKSFGARATEILHSLPITNFLKERFDEVKDSETIQWVWSTIREAANNVKESLPTPELKTLWDMVVAFLDKIVNNKPYDIKTEIKNISIQTAHGVRSVASNMSLQSAKDFADTLPQLSFTTIKDLPEMWGSALKTVYSLRDMDLYELGETLQTYNFVNTNSLNLLPPFKKVGVLVNGNQIVTMNGNYLQINDDCKYTLASDYENHTFSIAANIKDGKIASISVSSGQQVIEILPDTQQPKLNNADTDFPIYGNGIYAIRTPYTVEAFVDDSANVKCTTQLDICLVEVSGFYYNKVHGLMGTVNADSYIDFTMPNKKLARDVPAFIKAYQMDQCKVSSKPAPDSRSSNEQCAQMFNGNSSLKRGFSFLKVESFRKMCEEVVTEQTTPQVKMNEACKVAQSFSMLSYAYGHFLTLPAECSKCYVEKSPLPFGDTLHVQTPTKYAEIVVILDKTKNNERIYNEPVMNTLRSLRNGLKDKGISDIRFVLIGYGPKDVTPSIHTTGGRPYLSNRTKVVFADPGNETPSSDLGKSVGTIKHFLGMFDSRRGLEMANDYPYRPDSVKAIIHIKGTEDDTTSLDKFNIYNTLVNAITSWNIIQNKIPMFLVAPMDLLMSGTEANQAPTSEFGVDINNVYTADGPKPFENGFLDQMKFLQQYRTSVILPLSTQGAVFNSSAFSEPDTKIRNKLSNVFADAVARALSSTNRYSDCTCKYKLGVYSEVICSLASIEKAFVQMIHDERMGREMNKYSLLTRNSYRTYSMTPAKISLATFMNVFKFSHKPVSK